MTRIRAVVIDGPASAETLAAIRAELEAQPEMAIVVTGPSIREIAARICLEMGVSLPDLISGRHDRRTFRARRRLLAGAELTAKSLVQIGTVLHRDHSSVLFAVRRAEEFREGDPAFRRVTDRLAGELGEAL